MEDKKVIAVWGMTNTSSVNVWEMSQGNDGMLVGINDDEPEWCEIEYKLLSEIDEIAPEDIVLDDEGFEDSVACIRFNGMWLRLDECMKVNY
jgi:hypothetical protein